MESEPKAAYGAAKLGKTQSKSWKPAEYGLVGSLSLIVFTLTMASYYFYALLPAWEADHALSWTKSSTLTVNWMAELLEALGLLFAGPLADYIEPVQLIILEGLVAISGIFVTSTLQSASSVICAILSVAFLKGILWPSLGSIIFHSLRKEQQDVAFFCCALASRLSEAAGELVIGQLLRRGSTWRAVLVCLGSGELALFGSGIIFLHHLLASGIHSQVEEDPSSPTWTSSYSAKWARLITDLNAWLALTLLCGTSGIWALASYLALILQEKFELSSGASAMAASSLLAGTFVGLLVAGIYTYQRGHEAGRSLQLLQANAGLVAFMVIVFSPHLHLSACLLCLLIAGAGAGPLLYLPYTVYCSTVPRKQKAFALGVLDSLSQLFGCCVLALFGHFRIAIPLKAGRLMYDTTTVGFAITAAATMALYYRVGDNESRF